MKHNTHSIMIGRISGRTILCSFLLLTVFVLINLMSSTSKLSVIVDMSVKMKSDMFNVINDAFNGLGDMENHYINGTFNVRSFHSKNDLTKDYERWKTDHKLSSNISKLVVEAGTTEQSIPVNVFGNIVNSTVKYRQVNCDSCFEHNFKYIIQNENICKVNDGETIDLLVFILTIHPNIKARNAIRDTWITHSGRNTRHIRYVFLLGETKDENMRKIILEENSHFHDIVKEDFVDSYKNLTYKTIMGFKWAATKCAHARYVMKTDDDMFVNIPNLLKAIDKIGFEKMQTKVIGACSKKATPIRNQRSKWFASNESYPEKFYPGFCSGTGYATSMNVARKLYEVSPYVPFFHLEDVYVSLCIRKLNFTLQPTPGFSAGRQKLDACLYKGDRLITSHQLSPTMLKLIWNRPCVHKPPQVQQHSPVNKTSMV